MLYHETKTNRLLSDKQIIILAERIIAMLSIIIQIIEEGY
jgi:hypothetical protein